MSINAMQAVDVTCNIQHTRVHLAQIGAVIVSPTRELARQIHKVLLPFLESVPGLSSMLLVGGS